MLALVSSLGNSSLDDLQHLQDHPELQLHFRQGWRAREVAVRLVEGEGLKLFVVLHRSAATLRRPQGYMPVA